MPFVAGQVLPQGFSLVRKLGQGGQAEVWLGRRDGRLYALKLLVEQAPGGMPLDPEVRERLRDRFEREGVVAEAMQGEDDFVQSHGVEQGPEGELFLVMEYLDGWQTLEDLCEAQGPMPVEQALGLFERLLVALGKAHEKGIVHRDVKPANVFTKDGAMKVGDFGISLAQGLARLSGPDVFLGTPAYLAPEAVRGEYTARSDLYSAAVTVYALLTGGVLPHEGSAPASLVARKCLEPAAPLRKHRPDAPAAVGELFERALATRPQDRPGAEALLRMVREARRPQASGPASGVGRLAQVWRRLRLSAVA